MLSRQNSWKYIFFQHFNWSSLQVSFAVSAFNFGTIFFLIPNGYLAHLGNKKVLYGGSIITTGVLNILTPIMTVNFSWVGLLIARGLQGIVAASIIASNTALISNWSLPNKRGTTG